jgi:hypothetical protein
MPNQLRLIAQAAAPHQGVVVGRLPARRHRGKKKHIRPSIKKCFRSERLRHLPQNVGNNGSTAHRSIMQKFKSIVLNLARRLRPPPLVFAVAWTATGMAVVIFESGRPNEDK